VFEEGVPILIIDDVRIQHGSVVMTGREGRYNREAGYAVLDRDVRVVDGATTITGDHGTYELARGMATISGQVRIKRLDMEITSPRATYDRTGRVMQLGGGVTLTDAKRRVDADSVVYWSREDRARAFGNVRIDEVGEEAILRGDVADYRRREDDLELLERASVTLEEGGEPVEITARDLQFRGGGKEVVAKGNVLVRQKGTEAEAQNAFFYRSESRALLSAAPVARDPHGEVHGDSLELGFDQGELRRLIARGNARSAYGRPLPGGGREEMFLRGQVLRIELEDGEAREIQAEGDAETVYLPGGDRRESGALRNEARADRIRVMMETGEPERVILEGEAEGKYVYRRTVSDTTGAVVDTTGAVAGTARAVADTTRAVADTTRAVANTTRAVADTTHAPADTTRATEAGQSTPADSAVVARPDSVIAAKPDRWIVSRPDSMVVARPDSMAAAMLDSLALGPALPDSLVQTVRYQADRIDYLVQRDEIILDQHAELFHQDLHLTAGHVRFRAADRTLVASKDPVLEDRAQKMEGDAMAYDFTTREGSVMRGETEFERGLYSGARLFRAGDGALHVEGAAYTTCDLKPPHYHFAGHRMKIYLDDKVITRPLGLFIRRIPILGLPFYIFPIKRGRHSGFLLPQVEFGFSDTRGRFVRNAGYYWVVNDYADLKSWVDISEFSPFFIANVDARYALRYRLTGDLSTKLTLGEGARQWDVRGSHRQDLGQRRTLQANANFLSDREFRRESQGQFARDRLSTQLRSNLAFSKSWSSQSASVTLDRTQNLQNEVGETEEGIGRVTGSLPAVSYSLFNRPLGRPPDAKGRGARWPFLSSTHASFSTDYRRSFDTQREPDHYLQTASSRGSLSDRRQLKMLSVGPSLSVSSTWVEYRDQADSLGVLRRVAGANLSGQWTGSLGMQTELYGLFAPTIGPFHGFRHIATPRTSLSYSRPFDLDDEREPFPASSSVELAIVNRIETRLRGSKEILRRVPDFLVVNLGTNYDLSNRSAHRFAPIRADARLDPGIGQDFEIDYSLTYDAYARRPVRYDTSTRFTFVRAGRAGGEGAEREEGDVGNGSVGGDRGASGGGGTEGGGNGVPLGENGDDEGPGDAVGGGEVGYGAGAREREEGPAEDIFPHAFTVGGTLSFAGGRGDQSLQSAISTSFRLTPKWRFDYNLRYDLVEGEVVGQNYAIVRDLHCWQAQFRRTFETGRWEYYFRISIKDLPEIFYEKGRERFGLTRPF
jgi:lipopolysaccharide assembly outer membrane protein LptD (OstA)